MRSKPFLLLILDGWGHRSDAKHNAIKHAATPVWDMLWAHSPHTLLDPSGLAVGLPEGQMGNSEVGHMNLGAGRTVYQHLTRINRAIDEGEFSKNDVLMKAINHSIASHRPIHLMGLLSPGGVHSHQNHFFELIKLCHQMGVKKINVHVFLDGRDVPPKSAKDSIIQLEKLLEKVGGQIASLSGRFYAMDRDNRWDRISQAYDVIVETDTSSKLPINALSALEAGYLKGETDEFFVPTKVGHSNTEILDGDSLIFLNFRADRARQLSHAILDEQFDGFNRSRVVKFGYFVSLTEYDKDLNASVAFPPMTYPNSLGECLSK